MAAWLPCCTLQLQIHYPNSSATPAPVTASFALSSQDLAQAFSYALKQLLPGILTALQNSLMVGKMLIWLELQVAPLSQLLHYHHPSQVFVLGNITVPSFISTHSTLGNSSSSNASTVLQEDCYNFVHVVAGTHHSLSLAYPPILCCHLGLLSLQLWLFLS